MGESGHRFRLEVMRKSKLIKKKTKTKETKMIAVDSSLYFLQ